MSTTQDIKPAAPTKGDHCAATGDRTAKQVIADVSVCGGFAVVRVTGTSTGWWGGRLLRQADGTWQLGPGIERAKTAKGIRHELSRRYRCRWPDGSAVGPSANRRRCPRCGGSGIRDEYVELNGGSCWHCLGSGWVKK